VSKSARESLIFRLRPRQKVKQKQQCQRPEECEANLGQRLPRYRRNDVSHSANNNGGSDEDNGPEDTITYSLEYSFPHSPPLSGSSQDSTILVRGAVNQ
jgi:hypothetical protein